MRYIAAKWKPELLHVNDPVYYAKVEMMSGIVADLKSATTMPCYTGAMSRDLTPQTAAVNELGSSGSFNSEEEETFHPAE